MNISSSQTAVSIKSGLGKTNQHVSVLVILFVVSISNDTLDWIGVPRDSTLAASLPFNGLAGLVLGLLAMPSILRSEPMRLPPHSWVNTTARLNRDTLNGQPVRAVSANVLNAHSHTRTHAQQQQYYRQQQRSCVRVCVASQILGFIYLGTLQLPGMVCCMVWGSICCVFLILLAMGYGFVALCK